jgi:hypothetical protein
MTKSRMIIAYHLVIRHSFELRHSDFVILALVSDFEIRISKFDITSRLTLPHVARVDLHRNLFPARSAQF